MELEIPAWIHGKVEREGGRERIYVHLCEKEVYNVQCFSYKHIIWRAMHNEENVTNHNIGWSIRKEGSRNSDRNMWWDQLTQREKKGERGAQESSFQIKSDASVESGWIIFRAEKRLGIVCEGQQGALSVRSHIHMQNTQLNYTMACSIWDTSEWGQSVERKVTRDSRGPVNQAQLCILQWR